jgi:parvulin-like peptidyl-prolyl isomerase
MFTLATVNGEDLDLLSAIRLAIFAGDSFVQDAVTGVLLRQYAAERGITNTDAELQLAADELRYVRGHESTETLRQWLRDNHQDARSFQEGVDLMLLRNKIRGAIPDEEIKAYYAEHAVELETAELYSIRVDSEPLARELLAQMNHEGANFHVLAMAHSKDHESRPLGGFVGNLPRSRMAGVVAAAVFSARPVSVIGPIKTDHGWNLFKVTKLHKPTLEESAGGIRVTLMEKLVWTLRSQARVEYSSLDAAAAAV